MSYVKTYNVNFKRFLSFAIFLVDKFYNNLLSSMISNIMLFVYHTADQIVKPYGKLPSFTQLCAIYMMT